MGLPLVPFAIDVIVAAEDGAALVLGAAPWGSGVGGALCKNEQGAGRTRVSSPKGLNRGFWAPSGRGKAALWLPLMNRVPPPLASTSFNSHTTQVKLLARLAGHAAVVVPVAGQAPQAIAVVGPKAPFPRFGAYLGWSIPCENRSSPGSTGRDGRGIRS